MAVDVKMERLFVAILFTILTRAKNFKKFVFCFWAELAERAPLYSPFELQFASEVAWPSGLRRWFKAPVSSEAWVRIPPLPQEFLLFIFT